MHNGHVSYVVALNIGIIIECGKVLNELPSIAQTYYALLLNWIYSLKNMVTSQTPNP